MNEARHPLQWPLGWPRAKWRSRSKFGRGGEGAVISSSLTFLDQELVRLAATNPVLSTNLRIRLDGSHILMDRPADTGAAVYFTLEKQRLVLACDKWDRIGDNIWAIAKHVEALRGQKRWGVGSTEQAFAGYQALMHRTEQSCWEILELAPEASEAQILERWRVKAAIAHPDRGGTEEAFVRLNQAKDIALATARGRRAA